MAKKKLKLAPNQAMLTTECPEGAVYVVLVGSPALKPEYAKIMGIYTNEKSAKYRRQKLWDVGIRPEAHIVRYLLIEDGEL